MQGYVKWFNNDKGYGFLECDKYKNVFCHYSVIIDKGFKGLVQDENVIFDIVKTDKGFKAKNVRSINKLN